MAGQIRGIILEGLSCSGKTSLFRALKQVQAELKNGERNTIFLSEQYSQNLNLVNGRLKTLSKAQNLFVLQRRLALLEELADYADDMGPHSRRARGLFFVLERFQLNYRFCFPKAELSLIERRIRELNALTVVLTVSPEKVGERLSHRAGQRVPEETVQAWLADQQRLLELADGLTTPVMVVNTDCMNWKQIAEDLLSALEKQE